ncbi:MAG: restriction endonuclease subunit S, partial [Bacteroidota bacterium]
MSRETEIVDIKTNKKDVPAGYKQTEVGVIPQEWDLIPLKEFCLFSNGLNADKDDYGTGIPFINVLEAITYTHLYQEDIPGKVNITKNQLESFAVRKGDIVFNRTSETPGEIGLAAVYMDDDPVIFGGFVIRARFTKQLLDTIYSGYCLRSSIVRSQIIRKAQGAVRANIGQENLNIVKVPIPDKKEQRAIATALSDADNLIEFLEKLIAKKQDIKKATMQQLLTGKKRLPGFEGEWEVKRFGDIIFIQGGFAFKSLDYENMGKFPIIRISNIKNNLIDLSDIIYSNNDKIPEDFIIEKGDVLIAMSGATTGKTAIYKYNFISYQNQRVGKFVVKNKKCTSLKFISHLVLSHYFKAQLNKQLLQGAQ